MSKCAVASCRLSRKNKPANINFFRFPLKQKVYQKWCENLNIAEDQQRKRNLFVCSLHFAEKDLYETNRGKVLGKGLRKHSLPINISAIKKEPENRKHDSKVRVQLQRSDEKDFEANLWKRKYNEMLEVKNNQIADLKNQLERMQLNENKWKESALKICQTLSILEENLLPV